MTSGIEQLTNWQQVAQTIEPVSLGPTIVLSPHPDDESLGCGGTLALLQELGIPVHVVMISDGSKSHPNSQKYPAERLRNLREAETREALTELGLSPDTVTFLRLPDGAVPADPQTTTFADAADRLLTELNRHRPQTVFVPWRRDNHRDHRATYRLLQSALPRMTVQPSVLEYAVWLWELGQPDDMPQPNDHIRAIGIDISAVRDRKHRAIAAHASQVTQMIDDDPQAFWLRPDLLVYFDGNTELFFEAQ
ncbi:MAG: PIG-L family deacetylase [Cytophagales bacterium]|nr:MAG: PIG-L family deacetylase [Cytophagales bacterium]